MSIAPSLLRYFQRKEIAFQPHAHQPESSLSTLAFEFGIEPRQIAVPVLLQSARKASLMAVMPLSHSLDLDRIAALLRREFHYLDDAGIASWFPDVEAGAEPPVSEPYDLPCIVDRSLLDNGRIFFRGGTHSCLVSVSADDFRQLTAAYPKAVISNPPVANSFNLGAPLVSPESLRQYLQSLPRLPAMPAMALTIVRLLHSPDTTAADLGDALELDPSMAAQILRYASSPYFGYRGRLNSVQDAITRVLGFDMVSSVALGIAAGKAFNVPQEGPLGLKAFWKHALYCAVVSQSLARKINQPEKINPATAYLCGLLHNIGVLLMGHLFPEDFRVLNQLADVHPELPLKGLEQRAAESGNRSQILALGHDRIGGSLLELWRLPDAVVASCHHHHDAHYRGTGQDYVHLVQLSNRLLAQRQLGDLGVPETATEQFGAGLISVTAAEAVFEKVMEMCPEIDLLADHIAA